MREIKSRFKRIFRTTKGVKGRWERGIVLVLWNAVDIIAILCLGRLVFFFNFHVLLFLLSLFLGSASGGFSPTCRSSSSGGGYLEWLLLLFRFMVGGELKPFKFAEKYFRSDGVHPCLLN